MHMLSSYVTWQGLLRACVRAGKDYQILSEAPWTLLVIGTAPLQPFVKCSACFMQMCAGWVVRLQYHP